METKGVVGVIWGLHRGYMGFRVYQNQGSLPGGPHDKDHRIWGFILGSYHVGPN